MVTAEVALATIGCSESHHCCQVFDVAERWVDGWVAVLELCTCQLYGSCFVLFGTSSCLGCNYCERVLKPRQLVFSSWIC